MGCICHQVGKEDKSWSQAEDDDNDDWALKKSTIFGSDRKSLGNVETADDSFSGKEDSSRFSAMKPGYFESSSESALDMIRAGKSYLL